MGRLRKALLVMGFLIATCCSDRKAQELFETASFEELQKNYAHAEKLYRELLDKYPNSEVSRKAKERLEELGKKGQ